MLNGMKQKVKVLSSCGKYLLESNMGSTQPKMQLAKPNASLPESALAAWLVSPGGVSVGPPPLSQTHLCA